MEADKREKKLTYFLYLVCKRKWLLGLGNGKIFPLFQEINSEVYF